MTDSNSENYVRFDLEGFEATNTNSWNDNWKYVSDIMKILRLKLGDEFPKKYQAYVKENGTFESSGNIRYTWCLADVDKKDKDGNPKIVSQRTAMKSTSRKGESYYMVRTYEELEPSQA